MIKALETAVENYIKLLRARGYYVTVCCHGMKFFSAFPEKYNIHYHPFCLALKTSPEAWDKCILSQKKVYKKLAGGAFFGMCHAGVEEFVFPIFWATPSAHADSLTHTDASVHADFPLNPGSNVGTTGSLQPDSVFAEVRGFVSVSGYGVHEAEAKKRINRISSEYLISKEKLSSLYGKLNSVLPPFDILKAEIEPLCFMLSYLSEITDKAAATGYEEHSLYSRILTFINRHFADNITLRDISENCFCSVSAVSHIFVKNQGIPVMKYIKQKRLAEAKTLLLDSDFSVKTISEMMGFSDSNYFITCFKRAFGVPPSKFRRIKRQCKSVLQSADE